MAGRGTGRGILKRPPGTTERPFFTTTPVLCSIVPSAPANRASGVADRGSGHADTTNSCPTRATAVSDLRRNFVRVKRRKRH